MARREIHFTEGLLGILTYHSGGWRSVHGYISGQLRPKPGARKYVIDYKDVSENTIRTTLYRLRQNGLVEQEDGEWRITKMGRICIEHLQQQRTITLPQHTKRPESTHATKQMIISFDIPESKRNLRQWIRIELVYLGFELLQKSVWIGPAPLPASFVSALHEIDALQYMKFFHASEAEVI